MSEQQIKALKAYVDLMNNNATSQMMYAANELGVLDVLSESQHTANEVAEKCDSQVRPMTLLLDAMVAAGLLEQYGDDYALSPVMQLVPPEMRDLGNAHWQHLARFVRTGESIPEMEDVSQDEIDYKIHAAASQWMMTPAALDAAKALDIGKSRRDLQILEIAGGHSIWSMTIAHRDLTSKITLVDSPQALAAAEKTADEIGMSGRLTCIPVEGGEMELPADEYDLAILAHAVQLEAPDGVLTLLKKVFDALKPEGEVAIIETFSGQEEGDASRTLHELSLGMRTRRGQLHSPDQLQKLLMQVGFNKPQYAHLPSPPHTSGLMLAQKPASK